MNKKYFKSISFYLIIYVIFLLISKIILNIFNLEYMSYFYLFSENIIFLGILIDSIRYIIKSKMKKILKVVTTILAILVETFIFIIVLFFNYFPFISDDEVITIDKGIVIQNEKEIEINNKKVVVNNYTDLFGAHLRYYEYKNFLIRGTEEIHIYDIESGDS